MKKIFSLFLLVTALFSLPMSLRAEDLTVANGASTNSYLPVYGLWVDTKDTHGQCLYPADLLDDLVGGTISKMTFYLSSSAAEAWTATINVSLGETSQTSLSTTSFLSEGLSLVYSDALDATGSTLEVVFDSPFTYSGGNLIVDFLVATSGNYKSTTFYGIDDYDASGHYFYSTTNNVTSFLPKVTFTYVPAATGGCGTPKNLVTDGEITKEEVWLTWNIVEGADGYQLEYSKNSDFSEPLAPVEIGDYEDGEHYYAILDNMEAATTYYAHVRSICGEETGNWSSKISFTIPCDIVSSYPWSINFDDITAGNGVLPMCWSKINTSTSYGSYPYVSSSSAHSGNNSLYFYTSGGSSYADQYAILPQMDDLSGKRIVFWAKGYNASSKIIVGEIENTSDADKFSAIEEISLTTSYKKYAVNLSGTHHYIALKVANSSSSWTYNGAYIDDIKVEDVPSCLEPGDLAVSEIEATSAKFAWTKGDEEIAWQLCINGDEENLVNVTENPYVLSGLEAMTSYKVKVRAKCGDSDQSAWGDSVQFTTPAIPVVVGDAWSDDFEGASCGWEFINGTSTNAWAWGTAAYNGGTHALYVSNDGGVTNAYTHSATIVYATKLLALADGKYQFSYDWKANGESTWDYLRVALVPASEVLIAGTTPSSFSATGLPTTWNALDGGSKLNVVTEWQSKNVTIDVTAGNYYVVLAWKNDGGGGSNPPAAVDNFAITKIACEYVVAGLNSSDITSNAATISWTAGEATQWQVAYSQVSTFPAEGTEVSIESAATKALIGLSANTAYYVRVRAYCGGEDFGAWSEIKEFRTACTPYDAATWADGFEDGIYCWTVGNQQSTNESYIPSVTSSYYAKTGEHALKLNAYKSTYYSTNADSAYAILPEMTYGEGGISKYTLALSARAGGSDSNYNEHLYVCVGSDPSDIRTFTVVGDIETTATYADYEIDLAGYTGEGLRIALLAVIPSGTSSYLYGQFYVDDMRIFRTPTCQPLASIAVSDLSRRSMIVNLTPKSGHDLANAHELVYSTTELGEAALETADKIDINDTNKYEISGLDRETLYYIYVRANCGNEDGKSAWVSTSAKTKGLSACDDLQIGDGNATANLVYTSYGNTYSQQIYTAEELLAAGYSAGLLSAIHVQYSGSASSYDKTQSVYIGMTSASSFSGYTASDFIGDLTLVYGPTELSYQSGWREYAFNTPIVWDGISNIVVGVLTNSTQSTASGWSTYGTSGTEIRSIYKYRDSTPIDINDLSAVSYGSSSTNRPNLKFSFCYDLLACPAVTELNASVLGSGTTQEKISWAISDADYLSGFDMIVSEVELDADALAAAELTYSNIQGLSKDLDGLYPATDYYVYLRAICQAEEHNEGNSDWASVHFKTLADCPAVINLALALGATDSITATWERATMEQAKEFKYILSDVRLDDAALAASTPSAVNDTVIGFNALDHEKKYYFYVASACGEAVSAYVEDSIETLPACQKVENLTVVRAEHNRVELSWTSAQFASEAQWKVGIVGDPVPAQIVSERHAILFGLEPETIYEAYVLAKCGEDSYSDSVKVSFTTAGEPGACKQIGSGTSTEYGPVCGYYGYERNGYIFTAQDGLTSSGKILSLTWTGNSAATIPAKIYMKNTTETAFETSKSWNDLIADATLVLDASVVTANGTYEVDIEDFDFTGNNLMILVASNYGGSGGATVNSKYFNASGSEAHIYVRKDGSIDDNAAISSFSTKGTNNHLPNTQFCFEPKAVPDVTALAISDITTNSAKASWEPMGSETAWNVFISKDAAVTDFSDLSAYDVERVETLSKSFTGLADDTDYFVYVQPAVDGADFVGANFRTIAACLKQNAPAVVAESITAHTAIVKWVDPNAVKAGQYTVAYAKADEFDLENPLIATVQATDTFASLPALQADTVYKFAVKADCGETGASRWSDVAQFSTLESCFTPTSPVVVADSITAHSATVAWTDAHDDAGYIVAYGPYAAFDISDPATYQTINVTDTFVVLNGLNAATKYAFRVKGDCSTVGEGESKNWTNVVPFTTECEAISVVGGWNEDFNAYSGATSTYAPSAYPNDELPICWSFLNRSTTSSTYPQVFISSNSGYNVSGNSLFFKSAASSAIYAILPQFVEEISTLQLTFTYRNESTYDSNGTLYAGYMTDPSDASTFVSVLECEKTASLTEKEAVFTGAPAGSYIAFQYMGGSSQNYYLSIDNVMVGLIPTCIKPASVEAEVLSATSAQISWTAGGEETLFQYVCVLSGETPDWSGVEALAATEVVIDTLQLDTDYDFYVRAYCSETEQSDYRMTSFHVGYCVPAPTSVDAQGITAVAFNGTEISAAAHSTSAPYYANNADIELEVHADEADSLQITFATGYTYGTVIWVDWNNNLTFEASEVVYNGTSDATNPTTLNCVFYIPAATAEGIYRLRIGAADSFFDDYIDGDSSEADPCADGYYKLYEDYSIKVVSQGSGTGIDAIESKNAAIKRLENDQVVIIRDGKKYTIMGVKIQ